MVAAYKTVFGSIDDYRKGGVECLNDDPKRYVYSNMFEVAANSRPHERIAVARNLDYTIEVCRAEGLSPWMVCAHDEFVVAMEVGGKPLSTTDISARLGRWREDGQRAAFLVGGPDGLSGGGGGGGGGGAGHRCRGRGVCGRGRAATTTTTIR